MAKTTTTSEESKLSNLDERMTYSRPGELRIDLSKAKGPSYADELATEGEAIDKHFRTRRSVQWSRKKS